MQKLNRPQYQEVIVRKGWFRTKRGNLYGVLIKRIYIT